MFRLSQFSSKPDPIFASALPIKKKKEKEKGARAPLRTTTGISLEQSCQTDLYLDAELSNFCAFEKRGRVFCDQKLLSVQIWPPMEFGLFTPDTKAVELYLPSLLS